MEFETESFYIPADRNKEDNLSQNYTELTPDDSGCTDNDLPPDDSTCTDNDLPPNDSTSTGDKLPNTLDNDTTLRPDDGIFPRRYEKQWARRILSTIRESTTPLSRHGSTPAPDFSCELPAIQESDTFL